MRERGATGRERRRRTVALQQALREVATQLSLLNVRVGDNVDLRPVDLLCLDVIAREGPLGPSALARRAGLHPATVTGVLDRLERGRWIRRDRGLPDRRAVAVRTVRDRTADLFRQYAEMRGSLGAICDDYSADDLATITDFLTRVASAGRHAAERLAPDR